MELGFGRFENLRGESGRRIEEESGKILKGEVVLYEKICMERLIWRKRKRVGGEI